MRTCARNWRGRVGQRATIRLARRRRGHTLVECLVAMSLLSVTLTTVTLTLHTLYQADHRLRDELVYECELERFTAQLRTDTHPAVAATIRSSTVEISAADSLELSLGSDRKIRYSILPERIDRTSHQADTVQHRESYRLPPSARAKWQMQEDRTPPMVTLVLELRSGDRAGEGAVSSVVHIDAAVQLIRPDSTTPKD